MESGPLPPHERTWRHPSELGPTKHDVDTGPTSHIATLAAGTLAVLAVAAIIVVMTPRHSSVPVAGSATTAPRLTSTVTTPVLSLNRNTVMGASAPALSSSTLLTGTLLTTFSAYPHAIVAAPQPDLDSVEVATQQPDADDIVSLRTENITYRLRWELVPMVDAPDGSVIFDTTGAVVARIADGEVLTLVGG